MSDRIEPHVCAVCRTVLDWWVPADGSPGQWRHTIASAAENVHEAVPVPRREMTTVRTLCDYCGQLGTAVLYVLADRMRTMVVDDAGREVGGTSDSDGMWGACVECAGVRDTRSAAKLTAHVARRIEAVTGHPAEREILYRMYVEHLRIASVRVELEGETVWPS